MGNMAPWTACVLIITSWLCACVLIISFGLHILVSFVQGGHVELSSFHVSTTKRPIPNDSLVFEALALAYISVIHSMLDQSEIHTHHQSLCVILPIFNNLHLKYMKTSAPNDQSAAYILCSIQIFYYLVEGGPFTLSTGPEV